MSSIHRGYGAALENKANEIMRVSETPGGPVTLTVHHNSDAGDVVPSVSRKSDGAHVSMSQETVVSNENTGYTGNGSTLVFSGQSLNNTPVVPGTVVIEPTAGGQSVNASDRDGDGKLYTLDVDEDEVGTVNYFTGAVALSYPTGKAPNTGAINADYSYGQLTKPLGKKVYQILSLTGGDETLIVKAAGSADAEVQIDAYQSF